MILLLIEMTEIQFALFFLTATTFGIITTIAITSWWNNSRKRENECEDADPKQPVQFENKQVPYEAHSAQSFKMKFKVVNKANGIPVCGWGAFVEVNLPDPPSLVDPLNAGIIHMYEDPENQTEFVQVDVAIPQEQKRPIGTEYFFAVSGLNKVDPDDRHDTHEPRKP